MSKLTPLLLGENPLPEAPSVHIKDGHYCIPQHYLSYNHSKLSVESIVLDIDYDERFVLFVGEENNTLYLQVGVVGWDNYKPRQVQTGQKIVYGRKWRVEPQLPSSEIIQTAFLALQKAREHEIRELFKVSCSGQQFTPFNCHHDLPLMAQNLALISEKPQHITPSLAKRLFESVHYDKASLTLLNIECRKQNQWLVDFELCPDEATQLPELFKRDGTLIVKELTTNALFHGLMDLFLDWSNDHVESHFSYKGFNRFCRTKDVLDVGVLSVKTRSREARDEHENEKDAFTASFLQANYETDKSRVPNLRPGHLKNKVLDNLERLQLPDIYIRDLLKNN